MFINHRHLKQSSASHIYLILIDVLTTNLYAFYVCHLSIPRPLYENNY